MRAEVTINAAELSPALLEDIKRQLSEPMEPKVVYPDGSLGYACWNGKTRVRFRWNPETQEVRIGWNNPAEAGDDLVTIFQRMNAWKLVFEKMEEPWDCPPTEGSEKMHLTDLEGKVIPNIGVARYSFAMLGVPQRVP